MLGPELTGAPFPTPALAAAHTLTSSVLEEDQFNYSNNSLQAFAMDARATGNCLVCGKETKHRCSRCLEAANIDLFFCSPEFQKLVSPYKVTRDS